MRRTTGLLMIILAAILIVSGCSRGSSPTDPGFSGRLNESESVKNSTMLWGAWEIIIDAESETAEIAPVRGIQFTANVTQFLQPPISPVNLLSIQIDPSTDFPTGHVVVDVSLDHPFPSLTMYSGFDVRGVVVGNGSILGVKDSSIIYGGDESIKLNNQDGLTRWFNPVEFTSYGKIFGFTQGKLGTPSNNWTATLNPYKYFCDGLGKTDDIGDFFGNESNSNSRGLFSVSSLLTRRYDLQFPLSGGNPVYKFQYAVIASWEPPANNPPQVPDDYSLSANQQEAFLLDIEDQSNLYYVSSATKGGTLKLKVRVFDHQGAATSAGVSEEISAIHIESQNGLINSNLASFSGSSLTAALDSEDSVSATYVLEVTSVTPFASGDFSVLVIVESENPSGYDSGYPGFVFPDAVLSAYQLASVYVSPTLDAEAPVAVAEIVTSPPYCPNDPITFDASGSYDPDGGSIVSYEWDFDGDGIYGDSYDSGTDVMPTIKFIDFGVYEVDLKVTDDENASDKLDEKLDIAIGSGTWVDDDNVSGPWDGSFDHPWPTIQQGIDNASAGVCGPKWVLVKDGTYTEEIVMKSDMTVEGYSTPAPMITSPNGSVNHLISYSGSDNNTIKHFRVKPRTIGYGFNLDSGATGNKIEDVEFVDNPGGDTCSYGVYANAPYMGNVNRVIKNVGTNGYHISAGGGTSFIYASGGGTSVTDCVILNIEFTNADNGWGPNVFTFAYGDVNSLYAKNVIGHYKISGPDGAYPRVRAMLVASCNGSTLRNNLIFDYQNNQTGGWTRAIEVSPVTNLKMSHQTISGVKGPAWIETYDCSSGDPTNFVQRNHIIANLTAGTMGSWRWAFYGGSSSGPFIPVDYTCTWNVGTSFHPSGWQIEGTGCKLNVNPMFIDPSNDDYRLATGSPAKNAAHDGTDMGAYGGTDPLTWVP